MDNLAILARDFALHMVTLAMITVSVGALCFALAVLVGG